MHMPMHTPMHTPRSGPIQGNRNSSPLGHGKPRAQRQSCTVVSSWIFFLSRIVLRRALYIQGRLGGGQTSSINTHGLACRSESYSIFVVGKTSCGICDRTIVVRKSRVLAPAPSRRALPCSPCRALAPARALLSTRTHRPPLRLQYSVCVS